MEEQFEDPVPHCVLTLLLIHPHTPHIEAHHHLQALTETRRITDTLQEALIYTGSLLRVHAVTNKAKETSQVYSKTMYRYEVFIVIQLYVAHVL